MEEMATEPPAGFNKRRAEGRDKNDRPHKNLQLKSRKLNPVNTISYVQVFFFFFFGALRFRPSGFSLLCGFVKWVCFNLCDGEMEWNLGFFFFFFFV